MSAGQIVQNMAEEGAGHASAGAAAERGAGRRGLVARLSVEEVSYAVRAFKATMLPVSVALICASLATIYIKTEQSGAASGAYVVYDVEDDDDDDADDDSSSGSKAMTKIYESLVNALVIAVVLAVVTFGVVLLYKFRCMGFLNGYMIFASFMLLGLLGGVLWLTALDRWEMACDIVTFFYVLYNGSVVGVLSIFYQKGIPRALTQGYTVATAVILAWTLSSMSSWAAWTLLVVLAFYDLCAVLTPCGPLRALVTLMEEHEDPLPALMYEADLDHSSVGAGTAEAVPLQPRGDSEAQPNESENEKAHLLASSQAGQAQPRQRQPHLKGYGAEERELKGSTYQGVPPSDVADDHSAATSVPASATSGDAPGGGGEPRIHEPSRVPLEERSSIKLGLGDFVFYSVLVGKAAQYGFAACAATFVVIIGGLGITLVLLAVFQRALPALPVSILLGVLIYLLTRLTIVPFIESTSSVPVYL